MATDLDRVVEHLHRVLRPPGEGGRTDGQLLTRFVADRDEASFAALVRRHGPMVWRLCLRVLGHQQDAEDAFQASFLVLARKAAAIVKRESVGSFLYGVAYRIAREARATSARRRKREKQVDAMPHYEVSPPDEPDWRPWLDHELALLPEHYRAVIVACDLEGRSRKEAARHLGLSEGTISSRLARGRGLLAKRLARHGLALAGGAMATALGESASATLPGSLASVTGKAAVLIAAGDWTAVPLSVGNLMKGALKIMLLAKLKLVIGVVLVVAALGASSLVYRVSAQAPATERKPTSELEALRRENELLKLNLEVVLEKVRAQEAELRTMKVQARNEPKDQLGTWLATPHLSALAASDGKLIVAGDQLLRIWDANTGKEIKPNVKKPDVKKPEPVSPTKEELRRTLDTLEKAVKELREQLSKMESKPAPGGK